MSDAAKEAWESQQWSEGAISTIALAFAPPFFLGKQAINIHMRKKGAHAGAEGLIKGYTDPSLFPNLEHLFASWLREYGILAISFLLRHVDEDTAFCNQIAKELSHSVGEALLTSGLGLTSEQRAAMQAVTARNFRELVGALRPDNSPEELLTDVSDLLEIEAVVAPFVVRVIDECADPHTFEVLVDEARDVISKPPGGPSTMTVVEELCREYNETREGKGESPD